MLVLEKIIHFITLELGPRDHPSEEYDGPAEHDVCFLQLKAAQKFGYSEPFTFEQTAMNNILKNNGASKELTEKTWELYRKITRDDVTSP